MERHNPKGSGERWTEPGPSLNGGPIQRQVEEYSTGLIRLQRQWKVKSSESSQEEGKL